MQQQHPLIAREGWPFLAGAVVFAVGAMWLLGWLWSLPFWLVVLFVLQFFRDPARLPAGGATSVLAPADGRIVFVGPAHDPYLKRDAIKISIFMNVFNVHSNRSPIEGAVREVWYSPGKFLNAALDKASGDNERNALWLRSDAGDDVICVQVAGLIARRILCYSVAGQRLTRGERYGFIRFGSRVDVYLSANTQIRAALGDITQAARTVIAELPARG
jgi:phosphatidylserine decarboxylase